jgi:acyl-CoA synthetase (AMP-forming)/AMP-acid ligase II
LFQDTIVYIYTSGTTGLPKPAVINHIRFYGGGIIFFKAAGLTTSDIVYVSLPIYHSNGGVLGVGSAILSGATVVLRRKFSASQFWRDCIRHNCTAFFYVGEICRYLVNQQKSELDRAHKITRAIGNGMRRNIWIEFMQRFGNIKFCEVYGASEGNCAMSIFKRWGVLSPKIFYLRMFCGGALYQLFISFIF